MKKTLEVNFDGLVGPTHNYAGLALGNLASEKNAYKVSNPKEAALQGLKKMQLLMELGITQAVLPPHERPFIPFLRMLGFLGEDAVVLKTVYQKFPKIFRAVYSASNMWTANSATVTPSADSQDNRVHFTPANLISNLHRSLESDMNYRILNTIFSNQKYFAVHRSLFPHLDFSDEGAANYNRFCTEYGKKGLHVFVYGRSVLEKNKASPKRYPARQSLEASLAVARLHQLDPNQVLFVKQNPKIIDAGVFHNDVISLVNQNVFLYHKSAFQDSKTLLNFLKKKISYPLYLIPVSISELSVKAAVKSYLFNSQLVTLGKGNMALIAPFESQEIAEARRVLLRIVEEDNPIRSLYFVDCRQSMQNGGGPACLRLRVVLTKEEFSACKANIFLDETLYQRLFKWVQQHYRDRLTVRDLLDPTLIQESYTALDELTRILDLGPIYNFQKI